MCLDAFFSCFQSFITHVFVVVVVIDVVKRKLMIYLLSFYIALASASVSHPVLGWKARWMKRIFGNFSTVVPLSSCLFRFDNASLYAVVSVL